MHSPSNELDVITHIVGSEYLRNEKQTSDEISNRAGARWRVDDAGVLMALSM